MVLVVKSPPASSGDIRDMGSIPELGRFPGERSGNPLQYSFIVFYVFIYFNWRLIQFSSVAQSCPTLCHPMDCNTPASLFITNSQSLLKLRSIESVMPSNHLILCHPPLLPPSVFPSIKVFSNESALRIRWPKHWSITFNISPSNEHSGLISFTID